MKMLGVILYVFTLMLIVVFQFNVGVLSEFTDCQNLCLCDGTKVICENATLKTVPEFLHRNLTSLSFIGTGIKILQKNAFRKYPNIRFLSFTDRDVPCQLETIEAGAFNGLYHLKSITIGGCEKLQNIGPGVFTQFQSLETLDMFRNGIAAIPDFSAFSTRYGSGWLERIVIRENSQITEIRENSFSGVKTLELRLKGSKLGSIRNGAFFNASIYKLDLLDNIRLTVLEDNAFQGISGLKHLDLSNTAIKKLPTNGLTNIETLVIRETKTLKSFPAVVRFNKLIRAKLTYPHHCCAFKNPEKQYPAEWDDFRRRVEAECARTTSPFAAGTSTTPSPFGKFPRQKSTRRRSKRGLYVDELANQNIPYILQNESVRKWSSFGDGGIGNGNGFGNIVNSSEIGENTIDRPTQGGSFVTFTIPTNSTGYQSQVLCGEVVFMHRKVECTPVPDAFNPCEDVMGSEWLRIFVWLVVWATLIGNIIVLVVLLSNHKKMTVTKFLMCNLAFADFLMGVYLLLLAAIDIHTLGEYFNFAIAWQNEGGCQAAGFLTVFSSELSIFALTVITLERWYAISHAMHLTKRLKLRQSCVVMALGWLYAVLMAVLPLVGINGYGNVSVCLPMDITKTGDVVYVISLLVLNGLAFIVICMCYINMYCRVRGNDSTLHSSDTRIAKRMATLIFTNFICWAPIAFFGITAAAGWPLIDVSNSKILLVFFYPLNSCANPYLYVIITKQFRKDTILLLAKYGICTERANRCKGTVTNSKTLTHSRKNSLAVHSVIHPASNNLTHSTDVTIKENGVSNEPSSHELNVIEQNSPVKERNIRMLWKMQRSFSNSISSENQTERKLDSLQFYDMCNNADLLQEEDDSLASTAIGFQDQDQSCSQESLPEGNQHTHPETKPNCIQKSQSQNLEIDSNKAECVSSNEDLNAGHSSDNVSVETSKYLDCYKSLVAGNPSSVIKADDHLSRKSSIVSTVSQYDEKSTLYNGVEHR
ncbi:LOW QUALITY PROTEIN: follicle-stimulating hormone receptor-like [Saccostrea cucullata]|uniref:LOW QUALITY PROTEIN: follicle-stimulating hormone receptor-like n=1 Tax=Saccostrea cuccullata TaxID=36930 RepID=UPI002ED3A63F